MLTIRALDPWHLFVFDENVVDLDDVRECDGDDGICWHATCHEELSHEQVIEVKGLVNLIKLIERKCDLA